MEASSPFDRVFEWASRILWSTGACAAIGCGTAACLMILGSMVSHLWAILEPTRLCWEGQVNDGIDVEERHLKWSWLALPRLPNFDGFTMGSVGTVLKKG